MSTPAEQVAAARTGCAVAELPDRALLRITGPTRAKFLNNLVSNEVGSLTPGTGRRASLMDAKGHLLTLMRVLATEDALLLELPAERRAEVQRRLEFYRVAAPVRFAPTDDAVFAVVGPGTRALLESLGAPIPELASEAHAAATIGGHAVRVARAGDLPGEGYVLYGPAGVRDALQGAVALSREAMDVLRVEDGRPWFGADVTEANLLHETGLLKELHSGTKGCYVGQEIVARLEGRGGNVNRALRGLRLSAPAITGARVTAEGKDVGVVTTAATSPSLGPVAMAYVHRSRFEPGTAVEVDGASATVTALPLL